MSYGCRWFWCTLFDQMTFFKMADKITELRVPICVLHPGTPSWHRAIIDCVIKGLGTSTNFIQNNLNILLTKMTNVSREYDVLTKNQQKQYSNVIVMASQITIYTMRLPFTNGQSCGNCLHHVMTSSWTIAPLLRCHGMRDRQDAINSLWPRPDRCQQMTFSNVVWCK